MLAVLRIHDPGEEAVPLEAGVLFVHDERTVQVVGDVVVVQRGAGQAARLARAAPEQLADLEDAVVATVGVVGVGVKAGLVVGDADPGGEVVGPHAQRAELARQLTALQNARAGPGGAQQRTRQPRNAIHHSVRLSVLRLRTLFYVSGTTSRRAPHANCVAPVFSLQS